MNDRKNIDCLSSEFRYFCRLPYRNDDSDETIFHVKMATYGVFPELKQNIGTTNKLLNWLIPFDIIEQHADHLNLSSFAFHDNTTIWNCTMNRMSQKGL
jgi:hypothetical protein